MKLRQACILVSNSHSGYQFVTLCLHFCILLGSPLHVISMRLGMMRPAFLLEEIFDFRDMILNQYKSLITRCSCLQFGVTVDAEISRF
jgi:hypothetical protein